MKTLGWGRKNVWKTPGSNRSKLPLQYLSDKNSAMGKQQQAGKMGEQAYCTTSSSKGDGHLTGFVTNEPN
jgi:hypothetical protein